VLYIWCAATNPGDPGIFSSTKDLKLDSHRGRPLGEATADNNEKLSSMLERKDSPYWPRFSGIFCFPFSCLCKRCLHSNNQPSEQNICEEGMFFCSLCEAEVLLASPFSTHRIELMYLYILPLGLFNTNKCYSRHIIRLKPRVLFRALSINCHSLKCVALAHLHQNQYPC